MENRSLVFAVCLTSMFFLSAFSPVAFSSTVYLNPGETVVIQPNTSTTVVCGGGPATIDCTKAISVYESRYKVCKASYSASTCFNNEWPALKTRSPECVVEAFDSCNRTCVESYSSSTCYSNCR